MLKDDSLINIVTLSNISNVRYKVYREEALISDLVLSLTNVDISKKLSIMRSFKELVKLNIPSIWQAVTNKNPENEIIIIELWIFWFDDESANTIKQQLYLNELQETQSSSFSWSQWCKNNKTSSLVPGNEYKLFIKSIRNLVQNAMLMKKHGLVLGDFFVFPDTSDNDQKILADKNSTDSTNTMLAYTYNVYLTNHDLVFQPNVRRMRIRPLSFIDLYFENLKVLLSPTGEYANLISFESFPNQELEQNTLNQWSDFYNIPIERLQQKNDHVPLFITVRTASQDTVIYPSILAFVPTDTKETPSAVAGMNGIMGLNHGLAEDLGAKFSRFVYHERFATSENNDIPDYWSYRDPVWNASNIIFQALSSANSTYQRDQLILHRSLIEPIVPSPLMRSKSVCPSDYGSPSLKLGKPMSPITSDSHQEQLSEFTRFIYEIQPDQTPLMIKSLDTDITLEDIQTIPGQQLSQFEELQPNQELLLPPDAEQPTEQISAPINDADISVDTIYNRMDDLSLIGLGISEQEEAWNTGDDFVDLSMDVTDADFEFFESSTPANLPSTAISKTVGLSTLPEDENVDNLFTSLNQCMSATIETNAEVDKQTPADHLDSRPTSESLSLIPQDFLPVSVDSVVNDAKYEAGGKFMYPSHSTVTKKTSEVSYSPDYVPKFHSKTNSSKLSQESESDAFNDVAMSEAISISTSSSGVGYSSDATRSTDLEQITPLVMSDNTIEDRLKSLENFQKSVVYSIIKAKPAPLPSDRMRQFDYDTPFVSIVPEKKINPIHWGEGESLERAVLNLCHQAVFGGYPFAGGLAELTANGGEIDEKSDKIMAVRRTNMMQITRGVITHVPSLQSDILEFTVDFKELLKDIFAQRKDAMLQVESVGFLNDPPLGKFSVNGPLNIQQYSNLKNKNHQAHIKYRKHQKKKKGPNESKLNNIKPPSIVVARDNECLEGSPKMLPLWEKLNLQPYFTKKPIKYIVIYPDNPNITHIMKKFFDELSLVYNTCNLGTHQPENTTHLRNGLLPVPLSSSHTNATGINQRFQSYEYTCTKLGKLLNYQPENTNHTVIYIVNPGPNMFSYLEMCKCFHALQKSYKETDPEKYKENHFRLVLQVLPIDHILRCSSFGGYLLQGMKDIAFSVYSKCFTVVDRNAKDKSEGCTDFYSPPFILAKPIPSSIKYTLNYLKSYPSILDQKTKLHIAYCYSYDRAWMIVVWTDDRGELLEYSLFDRRTAYKETWERTRQIIKRAGFPWTIVLAKIGLMFNDELMAWSRVMTDLKSMNTCIISIDLESALNIHFGACNPGIATSERQQQQKPFPTFLDARGESHSEGVNNSSTLFQDIQHPEIAKAQLLVLNHRISYTHKREKAFKGILRLEAITENENWTTPLATGYLIHHSLPNDNVNPSMEQFDNEPFVAEIHLLYNLTSCSAYSVLQDIIKSLYALSFVSPVISNHSCLPYHIIIAERLSRLLLVINDSSK